MKSQPFPRVLFVTSAAFNRTTGGGITFGNLFAGWPKERLATAHNDSVPTTPETCERYFRLTSREIRRWGLLERLTPSVAANALPAATDGATRARSGVARAAKQIVFGRQLPDTGRLSAELEAWIAEFRPELLYTILGTNAMMELVAAIGQRFRLPLVVHMMDDWPETSYRGGLLAPLARRRMERLLASLMRRSAQRMAICDAMARAYERRYGVPFVSFQNTVDASRWQPLARQDSRSSGQGDIVYVGSILPEAQLDSLIDCCRAVAQLSGEGLPARLSIYSPRAYSGQWRERLIVGPSIELHDTITDDETFFRRIARADALLLPVNFDAHTIRYIRYSMPTKVPAYLLSGTPILAYGPGEVAQMRYADERGWALGVRRRSVAELASALRTLLGDAELRERVSRSARRTALAEHDAPSVRVRFQSCLSAAARGEPASG